MTERLCGSCGEPINPKRVQAIPSCTLCISCKEQNEPLAPEKFYVNTHNLKSLRDSNEIPVRVTVGRVKNRKLRESRSLVWISNSFVNKNETTERLNSKDIKKGVGELSE